MSRGPAVALLVALSVLASGCVPPWEEPDTGLDPRDFAVPPMGIADASFEPLPSGRTLARPSPGPNYTLSWSMAPVFIGGGFMEASISNNGTCDLWVYGVSFEWISQRTVSSKYVSAHVSPGETADLGLLEMPAQASPGVKSYSLGVSMLAYNGGPRSGWYDMGLLKGSAQDILVYPNSVSSGYSLEDADAECHNRWNSKMEEASDAVAAVVVNLTGGGGFTVEAALDAFDFVQGAIEYAPDSGDDEWSASTETLLRGFGDCEDQAILLTAVIDAMGGDSRGYVIDSHALAGVHVGDQSREAEVASLVQDHYGAGLPVRFLHDSGRSFLVLDPAGSLYAGGLPTGAALTADGWDFNCTATLRVVEATGRTVDYTLGQTAWRTTCGSQYFLLAVIVAGLLLSVGVIAFSYVFSGDGGSVMRPRGGGEDDETGRGGVLSARSAQGPIRVKEGAGGTALQSSVVKDGKPAGKSEKGKGS